MAWPLTKNKTWGHGEEPTRYDNQPVDANTLILEGMPVGLNPGSSPALCAHPAVAQVGELFGGFAERGADNLTADATKPNILYNQNVGDGTTGANGAKVRLRVEGLIRFDSDVPNGSGVSGSITGLGGTQADVGTVIYYNGTGFTTSSAGNAVKVGVIVAVGSTIFGSTYWDMRFRSDAIRLD